MLGTELIRQLRACGEDVEAITRSDFQIERDDPRSLAETIAGRLVVNCAALPPGSHEGSLYRVNSLFPRQLAILCHQSAARLVHISSNGVFSGRRGAYKESDLPDAADTYGVSKFLGEDPSAMVLRTSIIGIEPEGARRYLLNWVLSNAGGEVDGYSNHFWNGITTSMLASVIRRVARDDLWCAGIHHIRSPESVSKAELLRLIAEAFHVSVQVRPTMAAAPADRTLQATSPLTRDIVDQSLKQQLTVLAETALRCMPPLSVPEEQTGDACL